MGSDAIWDDDTIPDDDLLVRRVRRVPAHAALDYADNVVRVIANAINLDDDGISMWREKLLLDKDVGAGQICDWSDNAVITFTALEVRGRNSEYPAGVREVPDPDDPLLGETHALANAVDEQGRRVPRRGHGSTAGTTKTQRNAVKARIADRCTIYNAPDALEEARAERC